jgi:hypothetical protein
MPSQGEGNYTKTDTVVAIVLAAIATVWIIAYVIIFVQSGPA